jgi:hypothetical protein
MLALVWIILVLCWAAYPVERYLRARKATAYRLSVLRISRRIGRA